MKNPITIAVSIQEKNLLELIHNMKFGEIKVMIQDSNPIRVEQFVKSIEL
ncbi:DUF2292 domain-containing protein [Alkalibaculum sp. M08DMB]|uniref:DUF2292 domain-containing protein n=1 Tax=Alkalibaculum sporogenes TaxID=2655001 RepID=A0A6A7K8L9_9FIRM|nr:DUF2292 domain-containing protein [Alkalibaculum sporogenes]MPW25790.1 DUF2292 domain-containing protein [Alkalibaculum sporogenes]